jgi:hypothetical protein
MKNDEVKLNEAIWSVPELGTQAKINYYFGPLIKEGSYITRAYGSGITWDQQVSSWSTTVDAACITVEFPGLGRATITIKADTPERAKEIERKIRAIAELDTI